MTKHSSFSDKKIQRLLCADYHIIKNCKIFDVEKYSTELIRRLGYEISFSFLDEKTLINNTFLIEHNRDKGHQTFILFLVKSLVYNNIFIISPNIFNLQEALEKFNTKRKLNIINELNSYDNILIKIFKLYAYDDGNKYFLHLLSNFGEKELCEMNIYNIYDFESYDINKFYSEPFFNSSNKKHGENIVENEYINLFITSYNKEFFDYIFDKENSY